MKQTSKAVHSLTAEDEVGVFAGLPHTAVGVAAELQRASHRIDLLTDTQGSQQPCTRASSDRSPLSPHCHGPQSGPTTHTMLHMGCDHLMPRPACCDGINSCASRSAQRGDAHVRAGQVGCVNGNGVRFREPMSCRGVLASPFAPARFQHRPQGVPPPPSLSMGSSGTLLSSRKATATMWRVGARPTTAQQRASRPPPALQLASALESRYRQTAKARRTSLTAAQAHHGTYTRRLTASSIQHPAANSRAVCSGRGCGSLTSHPTQPAASTDAAVHREVAAAAPLPVPGVAAWDASVQKSV